jgi:DNA segregation ATPase FtsK/SpoIIIE, S-DNA-T family
VSRYEYRQYRRAMRRTGRRRRGGYPVMIAQYPYEPAAVMAFAALARFAYRHRSAFVPFWITGALFAVAAITHSRHHDLWILTATLTGTVGLVLGIPHRLFWTDGNKPVPGLITRAWEACGIDRTPERIYTTTVIVTAGTWLSAAIAVGPAVKPLPAIAVIGMLILGIPWWVHRRRRAKVRIERTVQSWPDLAENMGLPGSRIVSAAGDVWGYTARVVLRKGTPADAAIQHVAAIESGLGVRPGSIRAIPDPDRADAVIVRVIETDPHAHPVAWPGQPAASIHQSCALGLFEDGRPVTVSFLRRNALIGGTTGAGKSGVLNIAIAFLVACADVQVWGIDLKGGMELQPWASSITRLATSPRDATALLASAVTELDRRAAVLAGNARVLEPAPGVPAIVIVVDEYAELSPDALDYSDSLARRGRAVAVTQIAATQKPTQDAMGNTAVRSQMDVRICLRVREKRDADLILGQGMVTAGWQPHTLAKPGEFLISAPEHQVPERARAYLITDDEITAHAARHPKPHDAPPDAPQPPQASPQQPAGAASRPEPQQAPEAPEAALWNALLTAPPDGLEVWILMAVSRMSRSWVYYRLQELASAGCVEQVSHGHWRAVR